MQAIFKELQEIGPLVGHAARRGHSGPAGRKEEFLARIKADAERYKRVVQKAGVKPG